MRRAAIVLTLIAAGRVAFAQPEPAPPAEGEGAGSAQAPEPAPPPAAPPAPPTVTPVRVDPPPPAMPPEPETAPAANTGFRFGSYGRVIAGSDLRGGKPQAENVVAHGPRIVEPSYLELDFSFGFTTKRGLVLRPVITLAFNGTLFHDTGEFDAQPALRNMFLDAQVTKQLTAWVGSRMYRGDDIYLFDYWPLDDLNTVGGGLFFKQSALEIAAHAGFNRLLTPFQYQEIEVPNPAQGATTVVQLNRQRMIASATGAYIDDGGRGGLSLKAKLHGEVHALPSGTRQREGGSDFEALPSDSGFLIGAEVGAFGMSTEKLHRRHLNGFVRYAKGLAAFDELAPPTSFGTDLKTNRASELTFGLSGNWDHAFANVMLGALSRRFVDADPDSVDHDDGWEYAVNVRPLAHLGREVFAGVDLSYQARFPRGLNQTTQRAEDPAVLQIAPMLVYSPMGPSAYDRPQLRLVYRAANRNEAALHEYVPGDPRGRHAWTHFLGFQAEWWFNSSTYR
ncbi:MAG: carbohydrate porin [Deltaproteobacteria bacterium]|nr:carbohydrate porin [Deltaproteobacteria bacterium]